MTDTTTESIGSMVREAIVWKAMTIWLAATIGSTPRCGIAAWPPWPRMRDGELGGRRHDRAGLDREFAERQARHVVHAEHPVDAEPFHHAVLDHLVAAAAAFFRGLEDDRDGTGEIARLGQIFRCAEQHGRVPVMAAGMHLAGHGGGIGLAAGLADRQRVHVGAQADGRAVAQPAANHADHAGPADAGHDLVAAELGEPFGDEARPSSEHVETELRLAVDMPPPAR